MVKNIILMGAPGAGKGTLAKRLKEEFNLVHISTGDMFRDAIKAGTELGKLAQSYIDQGHFVPDEVTIGLVKERLSNKDCEQGFLLDGFPRTIPQAESLQEIAKEISRPIEAVVNLDCDYNELTRRITGRRVCTVCGAPYHVDSHPSIIEGKCDLCGGNLIQRKDDNVDTLKVRFALYKEQTEPILDYYSSLGLLHSFDSLKGIDELFDEVKLFLKR